MMMKPLLAALALAALPAAASSQPQSFGAWTVNGGEDGCIAHASLPQGTVVSLLAGSGQESVVFLIQNKSWSSLRDGSPHKLAVQLDGRSAFQFDAVARTDLDSDGPGLLFSVPPGERQGAKFLAEFAGASGMNVGEEGRPLAELRLTGGDTAMAALAKCMAGMWSGGADGAPGAASFRLNGKSTKL
jgi:hypothetical protein